MTPIGHMPEHAMVHIYEDGTWYYHHRPLSAPTVQRWFARTLVRDNFGRYWLQTPHLTVPVWVEDAPFCILDILLQGQNVDQCLYALTNTYEVVAINAQHPLMPSYQENGEKEVYVHIKRGDGLWPIEAKLTPYAMFDLFQQAVEDEDAPHHMGVWSDGVFFGLGPFDQAA